MESSSLTKEEISDAVEGALNTVLSRIRGQTPKPVGNSISPDEEEVPPLPPPLPFVANIDRKGKRK